MNLAATTASRSTQSGRRILQTVLALACLPALAGTRCLAQWPVASDHPVQARLVADVKSATAGQSFDLGIELQMEPGWHTYWIYPGDAGLPTEVDWKPEPGFRVGALRWPGPHKYDESGLVVYGYEDEIMLLSEVSAPAQLPPDAATARFEAQVSWLTCKDLCIPGSSALSLELPLAMARAEPDNVELFERYRAAVPTAPDASDPHITLVARRATEAGVTIGLLIDGGEGVAWADDELPDFYPSSATGAELRPARRRLKDDGSVLVELELLPLNSESPTELQGALAYRREGVDGIQYRSVALDLTQSPATAAPGGLLAGAVSVVKQQSGDTQLVVYLLMAMLGGLILNLMPCVLPVISLKVLGFVSQAGEDRATIRQLGLVFSAGVVTTFLALALIVVLLKSGGEQIGWGFQFQSPAFVLFLTALVFVLALSLFGLVTVRLPGIPGSLGGIAESEGYVGSFFNGVLATVLATPCTAPFLGTALGFAFTQPPLTVFAIFAATGLGMALPYTVLALKPGWARFVPRPGPWMERFKQFMAFLLMATALWLLWVLGKQLGMEAVIWTGAFLLSLAVATWILAEWVDLRSSNRRRLGAWTAAIVITAAGYWIFVHPLLTSEIEAVALSEPSGGDPDWQPFSVELVERLVAEDRHVFIDFTAEWCWTCKLNKRAVLDDEAVRAAFAEYGVALVRADWTNRNQEITRVLSAFGRSGVPLYVLLPGKRTDHPLVLPELITNGIVLEALHEAARLSEASALSTTQSASLDLRR